MPKSTFAALALSFRLLIPSTVIAGNIDTGTTCWMLTSTALVLLLKFFAPGVLARDMAL